MLKKRLSRNKFFFLFVAGVLLIQLFQIVYFQRETFLAPYNISYWKDRVEHSRYYLPLSNRGIGDEAFYAYAGYKILQGMDPTSLVFDKPALGLVLLGLVDSLYNPAYSGLIFGLACLIITFGIVYKLTKKALISLLTVVFLAADPLFFQSMGTSSLDLPQLFFLLANIFCFQLGGKRKYQLFSIFFSGLLLGIFAQIKIPVIYPFVFLLELGLLFKQYGRIASIIFLVGNIASIIPGYLPYAAHGYSFIDFIKIQKFILAFYRNSKLPVHIDAVWQYLFFGNLPGISNGVISRIAEWSLVYPIVTLLGIGFAVKILVKKSENYLAGIFAVIVLASLCIYTIIPLYPRYIILISPFLYYFMLRVLFSLGKKKSVVIISILSLYTLFNTFIYFHPSPSDFLSSFYNNLSKQYFQDMYTEDLDAQTQKQFTISQFRQISESAIYGAHVKNISVKEGSYEDTLFTNRIFVPVTVTFKTEYLGNFTEQGKIEVIKENDKWKVKWNWDDLLIGFNPSRHVESKRIIGKRGSVLNSKGKVIIHDTMGYLVSINPTVMDGKQENSMLHLLSKLSDIGASNIQNTYLENPPENEKMYIPLFTTQNDLTVKQKNQVLSYKGINLQTYPTRIFYGISPQTLVNINYDECCTRIYSSYNYHGNEKRKGIESLYDKQLAGYDGGSLQILDANGNIVRTIIQKDKKDGQNITLINP